MILGDLRNKELALGRIKRLASSGLLLDPFVRALFDLVNDAVPHSPNRVLLARGDSADAFIGTTPEARAVVAPHRHYYAEASSPELSGARIRFDPASLEQVFRLKTIWTHEEIALPHFYRTEGFNTVFKPMGFHHCLMVGFQEAGELAGYYPIWRSADQKPFTRDDIAFIKAAAPHIAHGLKAAQLMQRGHAEGDGFAPLPGWDSGVVLMDRTGKPIAMDAQATLIFQQLGALDGFSANKFAAPQVRDAIDYVTHTLKAIFSVASGDSSTTGVPLYRLYHHWTGIVLKLRGVQLMGSEGGEYVTVLLERGETSESRRRRLLIKWGLSDREAQVLSLVAEGKTGPEISLLLRISHDTARKHTSRIFEKLGVETRTAAASVAREFALNQAGPQ